MKMNFPTQMEKADMDETREDQNNEGRNNLKVQLEELGTRFERVDSSLKPHISQECQFSQFEQSQTYCHLQGICHP